MCMFHDKEGTRLIVTPFRITGWRYAWKCFTALRDYGVPGNVRLAFPLQSGIIKPDKWDWARGHNYKRCLPTSKNYGFHVFATKEGALAYHTGNCVVRVKVRGH